jgi:uncharacterized protein YbjT (DUF2867 family)
MKLLLLGATGLVGSSVLTQALSRGSVSKIIAPTRTPLSPHGKLVNPVSPQLEELASAMASHAPDAVICALGTTSKKAGSREAFRRVDVDLPIAFARAAYSAGADTFAIVTAMGASEKSLSFYYRTKGDVERAIKDVGFRSLTICRPSLIGGERNEARRAERAALAVLRFLAPVLPGKLRINPADTIASSLLDAVTAADQGCHWIHADDMN